MKMMFKAFAKKLFGAKHESLTRSLLVYLLVFWGLYISDFRVQIALSVRCLMVSVFTAGVMWQALSSQDNAANMQNMFMLPFDRRKFVFSYVAALGAYTIFTKTAALLAVLWAVSLCSPAEILGDAVCAIHAILMAAAVYSFRKYWYAGSLWTAAAIAAILLFGNQPWFVWALIGNGVLAVIFLQRADGYAFYLWDLPGGQKNHIIRGRKHYSVWRYLFRYLNCHKNYWINTVVMWGVALVLPFFFRQMGGLSAAPVCFAILSLNTPVCILLSCDPALQRAIWFLPGQEKAFCVPYCLFIFFCNLIADVIFLCSLQVQNGGVTVLIFSSAVFFALQSAILSVLLEWFYPVRNWQIESDLWRHPRKYIVPVILLLLAGAVGILPALMSILIILLVVEIAILLFLIWKRF